MFIVCVAWRRRVTLPAALLIAVTCYKNNHHCTMSNRLSYSAASASKEPHDVVVPPPPLSCLSTVLARRARAATLDLNEPQPSSPIIVERAGGLAPPLASRRPMARREAGLVNSMFIL